MNAYTLVDTQTRKKLDEMLKTWKEPVPGSLDTRPVFPPEITRNIENALIKARTAALQQQQARSQQDVLGRNRGTATPPGWKNTPTPPQPPHYPTSSGASYGHPANVQQPSSTANVSGGFRIFAPPAEAVIHL
jgi:pre-mRNA cleavage complex 2 protein Pcf11